MSIRVTLVEDDDGFRESLAVLLDGTNGFQCVGAHRSAEEALRKIPLERPDVVLMDINLPGRSGIECVRELKKQRADLQIMMLTSYEDNEELFRSLSAGASGYLLKRTSPSKLIDAISEVHQGGSPMSSQIARMVVRSFHQMGDTGIAAANLTGREREILEYLSKGYRTKEIAEALHLSPETVRTHLRSIYEKLHVRTRTQAVLKFLHE